MSNLIIKNGIIISPNEIRAEDLYISGERILGIGVSDSEEISKTIDIKAFTEIEANSCFVTPGLFDIQVNGGINCNFWQELKEEEVGEFSQSLLKHGTTSILPTIITTSRDRFCQNRDFLKKYFGAGYITKQDCATLSHKNILSVRMPGLHFEGPCLSPKKPGVHPTEHLRPLDEKILEEIIDESVKLMTLAPELDKGGKVIDFIKNKGIVVSLGHSNATYEEANQSFNQGVSMITHIFNALPSIHHRDPGAVTAALLNKSISACMIADGKHVDPACLELVYRLKGVDRTILVTDIAQIGTSQGGLVGSSIYLDESIRNLVYEWQICDFVQAIKMSSFNPADALGLSEHIGQIKKGAFADILIWDKNSFTIKKVIFNGKIIETN